MRTSNSFKWFYLFILIFFFPFQLINPQYYFEMSYGGFDSELATYVDITSDGGYIVAGSSSSFTADQNMFLLKLSEIGTVQWSRSYNTPGMIDRLHNVKQNTDGGYYLAGYIEGGFGFLDHSIMKVDADGNIIWAKNFGGIQADELRGLTITPDGGLLVSGYNASFGVGAKDVQAIKFLSSGNVEWAKTYGNIWEEFNGDNLILSDGNYLLVGAADISGSYSIRPLVIKIDPAGNIIWSKVYSGNFEDWAGSAIETDEGDLLILGDTRSYGLAGSQDIYLIKTDSFGNVLWAKAYGGLLNESGRCVIKSLDGKYVICGYTDSFGFGGQDAFLMKVDTNGNLEWFYTYGGQDGDYGRCVLETPDSGYVAVGNRSSNTLGYEDIYVIKTDKSGMSGCDFTAPNINVFTISNLQAINYNLNTQGTVSVSNLAITVSSPNPASIFYCGFVPVELKSFNYKIESEGIVLLWSTSTELNNLGFEIQRSVEGSEFVTVGFIDGKGTTSEPNDYSFTDKILYNGIYHYRLKQVDFNGNYEYSEVIEVDFHNIASYSLEQNYPNPFNPSTIIIYTLADAGKVTLKVYDLLGNEVATLVNEVLPAGRHKVVWDASSFFGGVYFCELSARGNTAVRKMLFIK